MTRRVIEETRTRQVRRDGALFEFIVNRYGTDTSCTSPRVELIAVVWTGQRWKRLHNIWV